MKNHTWWINQKSKKSEDIYTLATVASIQISSNKKSPIEETKKNNSTNYEEKKLLKLLPFGEYNVQWN